MDTLNLALWEKKLAVRGILGAAKQAGWKPQDAGWTYPVFDASGKTITHRWKAFDSSANPKYRWIPNKPTGADYYLLPGALDAIQRACGAVLLASGEPDVLAYIAAGSNNVLCWFGEGAIPPTLVTDLKSFGITSAECYPDRDRTGIGWAEGIHRRLTGSGIHFAAYTLPGAEGSKLDINQLWMNVQFDRERFWSEIGNCELITFAPAQITLPSTTDRAELPQAFIQAIERALGVSGYKDDGWAKSVRCPFGKHEHDDTKPAASWHRDKHIFSCFKCPDRTEVLAKEVGEALNIHLKDYLAPPIQVKTIAASKPAPRPKPAGKPQIAFTWDDASAIVLDELAGKLHESTYEPLTIPFANIREFGGLAASIPPGKIIAVVGDSGMGKTSFIETLVDHWRRWGFHGVFYGPEWTHTEYVYRAIQRQGGPSVMDIVHYKSWLASEARGVPVDKRAGKPLSAEQREYATTLTKKVQGWPGKLVFVQKMALSDNELFKQMGEVVDMYAAAGNRIAFAVVDYAQILNGSGEKASDRIDHALAAFKAFCVDRQLVGIVGSQVPKVDGANVAKGNSKLSLHSIQNGRSDYFNLVLTINRAIDEQGYINPEATIRIGKNSLGSNGDAKMEIDGKRLLWKDTKNDPNASAPLNF